MSKLLRFIGAVIAIIGAISLYLTVIGLGNEMYPYNFPLSPMEKIMKNKITFIEELVVFAIGFVIIGIGIKRCRPA